MNKDRLLRQLEWSKKDYLHGLAAIALFNSEESYNILENKFVNFGSHKFAFKNISDLLKNDTDRKNALKRFLTMLIRSLIKESFELIKDYSKLDNKDSLFKAEPWYQFARMIRNCLSHNGRFEFNKYDQTKLPVSWKSKTISFDMENSEIQLSFFGTTEAWELFCEYQDFATIRL